MKLWLKLAEQLLIFSANESSLFVVKHIIVFLLFIGNQIEWLFYESHCTTILKSRAVTRTNGYHVRKKLWIKTSIKYTCSKYIEVIFAHFVLHKLAFDGHDLDKKTVMQSYFGNPKVDHTIQSSVAVHCHIYFFKHPTGHVTAAEKGSHFCYPYAIRVWMRPVGGSWLWGAFAT